VAWEDVGVTRLEMACIPDADGIGGRRIACLDRCDQRWSRMVRNGCTVMAASTNTMR
jgi:hypothetical protein